MGSGKELKAYRDELNTHTARIDERLASAAETIDALRRRAVDVDEAVRTLQAEEDELDARSQDLQGMLAPEELHGLHMEYEANLERALRGIVTAERGCAITKLPHRPPDDEEPFNYWKRAHANIVHARLRMQEVVEVLLAWEPGRRAEVSVTTRLHRDAF
jgi:DNA repair exonuclease SbcCD ATPase subunit